MRGAWVSRSPSQCFAHPSSTARGRRPRGTSRTLARLVGRSVRDADPHRQFAVVKTHKDRYTATGMLQVRQGVQRQHALQMGRHNVQPTTAIAHNTNVLCHTPLSLLHWLKSK